ncbi:MAG TPA: hypothetical protein ACFE0H_10510 [Elainellaceae cyanobacterium]
MEDFSPYLQKLLALYDEKRKRFQWSFTVLMVGAIAFFFFVFFPYLTLLGNRADCLSQQAQCTQLETSILDDRFTEVTTSWGNIPISTSEVVVLFPMLIAVGVLAVSSQLITLMRLRKAIQTQGATLPSAIDVTLIAPILLDPKRGLIDVAAGAGAFMIPVLIGFYSINLIYVRLTDLRSALPYSQSVSFYHKLYLLSVIIILFSLARVGLAFIQFWMKRRS